MFTLPIGVYRRKIFPVQLVEVVSGAVSGSDTLNVNLSATPEDGDFLLWVAAARDAFTPNFTTPAGFTNFMSGGASNSLDGDAGVFKLEAFGRLASGEGGTGYSITESGADDMAGMLSVWRRTNENDGSPSSSGWGLAGTGSTLGFSNIQTGGADLDIEVIAMIVNKSGATPVDISTPPAGFIEVDGLGYDQNGNVGAIGTYDRILVAYYQETRSLPSAPPFSPQLGLSTSASGLTLRVRLTGG